MTKPPVVIEPASDDKGVLRVDTKVGPYGPVPKHEEGGTVLCSPADGEPQAATDQAPDKNAGKTPGRSGPA